MERRIHRRRLRVDAPRAGRAYSAALDWNSYPALAASQYDRALDLLEPLLEIPFFLSPERLRIDSIFAPFRGNPSFEKLIAGA